MNITQPELLQIGSVFFNNNTIFAPLAGISNLPLRLLAKEAGCGLVCSEMISSNGLVYKSKKTEELAQSSLEEKPFSVQIFGSDPQIMAEAARIVEATGADIIDINFGCSVKKVIKTGAGAALMKDQDKTAAIISAVKKAINIPLTIKIRSGWDKSGDQALLIAQIAQDCGVDAIAIHPRSASQGFSGNADWSIIAKIKKKLTIPIIGNGDICTPFDAVKMQKETGCDFIMIGRAAIGNPLLFTQTISFLNGNETIDLNISRHFEIIRKYLKTSVKYFGEKQACFMMRSRLCWFIKGFTNSSKFRKSINHISSEAEALKLIRDYQNFLEKQP